MLPLEWKYPPAVLEERRRVELGGDFRAKTQFDLAGRPPYAWGLLTAADAARFFGNDKVTAIEFGVARGDGLIELCRLADPVTELTGVPSISLDSTMASACRRPPTIAITRKSGRGEILPW